MATSLRNTGGAARSIEAMVRAKLIADYPTRRFREPGRLAGLLTQWRVRLLATVRKAAGHT